MAATAAAHAPARTPAASRPERSPAVRRRRAPRQAGVLGGVLWIVVLAVLLAGVVALNVAVLQLNLRLDDLASERGNLRAANAALAAELSSASAAPQVEALAHSRLGLVPAPAEDTFYVDLRSAGK
jgi:hypothetical protein